MASRNAPRNPAGLLLALIQASSVRVLGAGAAFLATLIVTRMLGAAGAGILFGTYAWAVGLALAARWGSGNAIMLDIPPRNTAWRRSGIASYGNGQLAGAIKRTVLLLMLVALCILIFRWTDYRPELSFSLLIPLLPLTVVLQILCAISRGMDKPASSLFFEFLMLPLVVLLVAGAVAVKAIGPSLDLFALAYIAGTGLAALSCFLFNLLPFWHLRRARARTLRKQNRQRNFALVELAFFLNSWAAMLMLPFFLSAHQIGIFNLVFRLVASVGLIVTTIQILILPRLSLAWRNRDGEAWRRAMRDGKIVMAALGLLYTTGIFIAGKHILGLAGHEFIAGYPELLIMSACYGAGIALGPSAFILNAAGFDALVSRISTSISLGSVLALLPALYCFGMTGVAWVTGITMLTLSGTLFACERRMIPQAGRSRHRPVDLQA
jgi:O-antigen/teichoic acid export membrane protein